MLGKQAVCILGYGNIGSRIGKLISAFGSKLLIVDDEARIRALIAKYAAFEGYETEEADNGMKAVEMCRKNRDCTEGRRHYKRWNFYMLRALQ